MVLKRSRRLRAATILGEAVSIATLTRKASADLQSRSDVSRRAMVRAGGTVVTASGRPEDASVARRLRVAHSVTTRWLPPYPASRRRLQSSAPFRQPAFQSAFSRSAPAIERGLARSEHVVAGPGQNAANSLARHAGRPDDTLDAVSLAVQGSHRPVHLVAALPSGPLQLLGRAEGVGIDVAAGDGAAKVAHVSLHALDKGGGGVLQQVPAVGDLQRLRSALGGPLAIATAAVAADDLDAGMRCEPVPHGAALPIR